MNDAILIQHTLFNTNHSKLLSLTIQHHLDYCSKWNFDYRYECSTLRDGWGDWDKVVAIGRAIKHYKYVIWLDVDAMIVDFKMDLRKGCVKPINAVEYPDPNPHYHVGVLFFEYHPLLIDFLAEWNERKGNNPVWGEQGSFNYLVRNKYEPIMYKLPEEWNSSNYYNPCKHPVIKAWHGWTEFKPRYESMKQELEG